jgi:hypothetical protein
VIGVPRGEDLARVVLAAEDELHPNALFNGSRCLKQSLVAVAQPSL